MAVSLNSRLVSNKVEEEVTSFTSLQNRGVVVTDAGSYLRLIDSCITQLKAQGPSRTCNESKEEEKKKNLPNARGKVNTRRESRQKVRKLTHATFPLRQTRPDISYQSC